MKKKSAKAIRADESIHFVPGEHLGTAINTYAEHWETSSGVAAKRLVEVALNESNTGIPQTASKKKLSKSIRPKETIHFAPGKILGIAIASHAVNWGTSRGDAAKRLITLAVSRLDVGFHDIAMDVVRYASDSPKFEEACARIQVHIVKETAERHASGQLVDSRDERLQIARDLLDPYRRINQIEQEAEEERRKLKVYLYEY